MQFSLRSILGLFLALSLLLAAWKWFQGSVGVHELAMLAVGTLCLMYGILRRRYWPTAIGGCVIAGIAVTPADPISSISVAALLLLAAVVGWIVVLRRHRRDTAPE